MARKKAPLPEALTDNDSAMDPVSTESTDNWSSSVTDFGTDEEISPSLIHASPLNPRKWFDPEELQQLAESLKTHGQLQNLTVRRRTDGEYDLIGGERRLRAALLAQLPTLRCRVIECDDAMAVELRGIENYRRAQLNAVEEALWFQQMIETGRFNQTSLAAHLKITPGQVSNRIRLLKLPDDLQQLIGNGRLPATHARSLLPWVERPAILQALQSEKVLEGADTMTVDELERAIAEIAFDQSRPMDADYWDGPKFVITEELQTQLDLQEVRKMYGTGKAFRAFNVELWDRLQAEAKTAAEEARAKRLAEEDDGAMNSGTPARDPSVSRLNNCALERHVAAHMSSVLAGRIKADAISLRVFFLAAMDETAFPEWLGRRAGVTEDFPEEAELWDWTKELTVKNLMPLMVEFLQDYLATDRSALSVSTIKLISHEAGINPLEKWQPDAELLDLCSDNQLRELFTEQMAPESKVKKWGRARLLKEALENWPAGYLPALLTPRSLMTPTMIGASQNDDDPDEDE